MSVPTVVGTERSPPGTIGDAAALVFRRRVQAIDRIARTLISVSGIAIIAAVLGIGLFLFLEIAPLLAGARVQPGRVRPALLDGATPRFVRVDEHQERALVVGADPVVHVVGLSDNEPDDMVPLAGLEGHRISAVSSTLQMPTVALGTERGVIWIGVLDLRTAFDGAVRHIQPVVEPAWIVEAVPGHRIEALAYRDAGSRSVLASIVADGPHVIVTRITTQPGLIEPVRRAHENLGVPMAPFGEPTTVLLNETGTQLLAGTSYGFVTRWHLPQAGNAELIEAVQAVPGGSVTTMAYLLGNRSIAVGGSEGSVATWSLVRDEAKPDGWALTRIHMFPRHVAAVDAIVASPRDKGFLTVSTEGVARLHYMTSERTLAQFTLDGPPVAADFAPKADGAAFLTPDGRLHHWRIHNPHPEVSWRALFGNVWYEGYGRPDYIWQSTGGTDDFESKFSLVPLVFGTLKGTCYAMLFAVPLALFGALYCSQFLDRHLRSPVKSTIELMAALPSVVMGFVAGVVLAPLVQGRIVSVLSLPVLLPLVAMGGMALGVRCPVPAVRTFVRRHEFWLLMAWIGVGVAIAGWLGPWIERWGFRGDFQAWLFDATGMRYDQRNSLVVGWAMGFAIIPIIFTMCEDAFSAVPTHLVGASLACGASAWQTAWRVVLPAAGSGVFSAIMVGFGRAVGETMIVLMATGNTPVLDWSMFNGFRALSANIAVEIPEAPHGGTLYRVLFVAALLLFTITFIVNTAAELIRLRLRRQLQGL